MEAFGLDHRLAEPVSTPLANSLLVVEKIDTLEQLLALQAQWRELEVASGNALPFRTSDWAISWWTNFRENRTVVSDSLFVRALRTHSGQLVAVAPMMRTERPAVGPFRVKVLQFFGPDGYVTELSGPLCLPAFEERAIETLLDHLRASASSWDWLMWRGLRVGGPWEHAVAASGSVEWGEEVPGYILPLAGTWEEFRAQLPRNVKESLRKCYNSLKRDGHTFSFEIARRPEEIGAALELFCRLHSARAALTGTVKHKDFFIAPKARRFLIDVCGRFAERGMVRVFMLRVGTDVVAARIGFVIGKSLYLYYSGYDPAFGKYSVMTTVVAEALRSAISENLTSVNLSMGRDLSKTRWRPNQTLYREALQISPSSRARLTLSAYRNIRKGLRSPPIRWLTSRLLWRRLD
jgi:CelD/BcsL family acetyltransferase involved in cellulose biosynthesis